MASWPGDLPTDQKHFQDRTLGPEFFSSNPVGTAQFMTSLQEKTDGRNAGPLETPAQHSTC
jgi:hypothetical protein